MRSFLVGFILLAGGELCLAQSDSVAFQLILVGNAGAIDSSQASQFISRHIPASSVPSAVVFLGDNVPKGFPAPRAKYRRANERILLNELAMASVYGSVFFVPGDFDWKNGHHEGLQNLSNQQAFLDSLKNPKVRLLPADGCPGPEEVQLTPDIVLVILDTQWFLHPWDKPSGETSHCDSKSEGDVIVHLDDILDRNQGKRVIVAGHHPVYTYGPHGGEFTLNDHLFPFTQLNRNLYIPLPIIGSLSPLYRKFIGNSQDIAHPAYKDLRHGLRDIMKQYPGTIYASGHEDGLQYIEHSSVQYIVTGAGSRGFKVRKKQFSQFASSETGIVRMLMNVDGTAKIEYYSSKGKQYDVLIPKVKTLVPDNLASGETDSLWVRTNASYQYEAGGLRTMLLGKNYRAEWSQKFPLLAFDVGHEKGGLKILQKGGGMETMALRLRDSVGREYVLRTVEKYPAKALPPAFRRTFIQSVKQDQVSASHPYGALIVPSLEQAAGIYHANPRIVYAPDDPRWGKYRKDFHGQIMLFEERPEGSGKNMPSFGNPEKMISTRRVLEHMAHDNDAVIDQKMVLKARLFDMWIGDWDRHDDQWRWGEFNQKKTRTFRPIPRDRDQAFFVNEGLGPHRWRKRYLFPNLEGFDYKIRWAPGLMMTGRWFDRTFLNAMSENDFQQAAGELTRQMSDGIIDSALRQWPSEIYGLHGKVISEKLKARRAVLARSADDYFRFLSREVDVVGSNRREWFEGIWEENGRFSLQMYKRNKAGERGKLLYEREFLPHQTREVDLYGLGGDDYFHFSGPGHHKMRVRIIGGEGLDALKNEAAGASRIYLYDDKDGVVREGHPVHDRTSGDPHVNDYDRKWFEYNRIAPRNTLGYNVDDGVIVKLGFSTFSRGFRRTPYKSHHLLGFTYGLNTSSFSLLYQGRFPQFVGKWSLELDALIRSPNYVNNFFGWGNESVFDQQINQQPSVAVKSPIDFYRLRIRDFAGEARLSRKIGQWSYIKVGPAYQRGQIIEPPGNLYIKEYSAAQPEPILGVPRDYFGVAESFSIDKRDNRSFTTRGIVLHQSSRWMSGDNYFSTHFASLTLYQSFRLPARVTLVFNAGAGHNTGSYQIYQAQTLDGGMEIRGYHKTRFYGNTKVYFNNEVRIKLGSLRTYLFPAAVGMHLFYDVGRVWYKDANGIDTSTLSGSSNAWHKGYGGGLWFMPYDLTTFVTEVGHSEEGTLFYLRLGFLF